MQVGRGQRERTTAGMSICDSSHLVSVDGHTRFALYCVLTYQLVYPAHSRAAHSSNNNKRAVRLPRREAPKPDYMAPEVEDDGQAAGKLSGVGCSKGPTSQRDEPEVSENTEKPPAEQGTHRQPHLRKKQL